MPGANGRWSVLVAALLGCGGVAVDCPTGPCPVVNAPRADAFGETGFAPGRQGEVARLEPTLCRDNPVLHLGDPPDNGENNSSVADTQERLNAWAGCRVLEGNVTIVEFPGIDLSPLAALQWVTGDLTILGQTNGQPESPNPEYPRLNGLNGLEGLSAVGSLQLLFLEITSLEGLSQLKEVGGEGREDGTASGELRITGCGQLTTLQGLNNVEAYRSLLLTGNTALSHVYDLRGMQELERLDVSDNPLLVDVGSIVPNRAQVVRVSEMSFTDLEGMVRLTEVEELRISNNAHLETLRGIELLTQLGWLYIRANRALQYPMEFELLESLDGLVVEYNSRLLSPPLFSEVQALGGDAVIKIYGNDEMIAVANFPKLVEATNVCIQSNHQLFRVELPQLQRVVSTLSVRGNGALQPQWLEQLGEVRADKKFLSLNGEFTDANGERQGLGPCAPSAATSE